MAPEKSQAGDARLSRRHGRPLWSRSRPRLEGRGLRDRFEGPEPEVRRWVSDTADVRKEDAIFSEIATQLRASGVHSVAMVDRIIGCPHEEGIDYPTGESCPQCPYWEGRDRWSDE